MGRAIPRQGYDILNESGEIIGRVTSGTKSPSFGDSLGVSDTVGRVEFESAVRNTQILQPDEKIEPQYVFGFYYSSPISRLVVNCLVLNFFDVLVSHSVGMGPE